MSPKRSVLNFNTYYEKEHKVGEIRNVKKSITKCLPVRETAPRHRHVQIDSEHDAPIPQAAAALGANTAVHRDSFTFL